MWPRHEKRRWSCQHCHRHHLVGNKQRGVRVEERERESDVPEKVNTKLEELPCKER